MKPFRQGALDATCGLYAVINAIRLAVCPLRVLPSTTCLELHLYLVSIVEERLDGIATVIETGLGSQDMKVLLRAAHDWLIKNENVNLTWSKPFRSRHPPCPKAFFLLLHKHLESGGSAILGISGKEEHWTVLRKIAPKSLLLMDSIGLCRMPHASIQNLNGTQDSAWIVNAESTFFISCSWHEWGKEANLPL